MTTGTQHKGRVLITGASGFLGRFVPSLLLEQGFDVHVVVRSSARARECWPAAVSDSCTFHELDLLSDDSWGSSVAEIGATHLLHLAWIATPGLYWTSPDNLRWLESSIKLLRSFARGAGKRAVVAGSCAEYDWHFEVLDELKTPIAPTTLYGTAKAALSERCITGAEALGLSTATATIFFPYGPFENRGRLLPDVICALLAGNEAACSEGHQVRDFIYVEDAAAALVALLNSAVEGRVNIASSQGHSVREIVARVSRLIGREDLIRFGARPLASNEPPRLVATTLRLNNEVGFTPRFDLANGLERTVDWWRSETGNMR